MFRKSRTQKVADQASDVSSHVVDQLRDKVVPAVGHAAETTRDWAAPRAVAAKDWAAPAPSPVPPPPATGRRPGPRRAWTPRRPSSSPPSRW